MENLITIAEASRRYGYSRECFHRAITRGSLVPVLRSPRATLLRVADVEAYIAIPRKRGRPSLK